MDITAILRLVLDTALGWAATWASKTQTTVDDTIIADVKDFVDGPRFADAVSFFETMLSIAKTVPASTPTSEVITKAAQAHAAKSA